MSKPRILGLAQEVLKPGKWVSIPAAKILLGYTGSNRFYDAVNADVFRHKETENDDGKKVVLYLYADLCAYADSNGIKIGSYMCDWLEMIAWADAQTGTPTEGEMLVNVRGKYTLQDMICLIETRRLRGVRDIRVIYPKTSDGFKCGDQVGSKNNNTEMDDDKVRDIRAQLADGATRAEMASEHDISLRSVGNIETRKTWGHVE